MYIDVQRSICAWHMAKNVSPMNPSVSRWIHLFRWFRRETLGTSQIQRSQLEAVALAWPWVQKSRCIPKVQQVSGRWPAIYPSVTPPSGQFRLKGKVSKTAILATSPPVRPLADFQAAVGWKKAPEMVRSSDGNWSMDFSWSLVHGIFHRIWHSCGQIAPNS